MSKIRFVNRTRQVFRCSTPRGGRIALATGEFVTDPYYERFARLHSEKDKDGKRVLVKEYEDGTPVGVDEITEDFTAHLPLPPQVNGSKSAVNNRVELPVGCETTCEVACQFPAEMNPDTVDTINAEMDKSQPVETPPLENIDHNLVEPGMAPPINQNLGGDALPQPQPQHGEKGSPAPAPMIDESLLNSRATIEQVMNYYSLTEQDILDINNDFVKVTIDGENVYVSRIELGWRTPHLKAMKAHVTRNTPTN